MKKREWKYLRKKWLLKLGYGTWTMTTHTFPIIKEPVWSNKTMGNFAMMIPTEPFKPWRKSQPTRTQVRFNYERLGITTK